MNLTLSIAPIENDGNIGAVTDEVIAVVPNETNAGDAPTDIGYTIIEAVNRIRRDNPSVIGLDMTLAIDN